MVGFDPNDENMRVDTPNFSAFFDNEDVRRHALSIIQSMKSLKKCEEHLIEEDIREWRNTIMAMVKLFSDIYDTRGLPVMQMHECQDENSNNNNNNNNNNINVDPEPLIEGGRRTRSSIKRKAKRRHRRQTRK